MYNGFAPAHQNRIDNNQIINMPVGVDCTGHCGNTAFRNTSSLVTAPFNRCTLSDSAPAGGAATTAALGRTSTTSVGATT